MANISTFLQRIKTAIYGREVRDSIHDAINAINTESEATKAEVDEFIQGNLDTTLESTTLPAQGKAVGDAIAAEVSAREAEVTDLKSEISYNNDIKASLVWYQGGVSSTDGSNQSTNTRIRSNIIEVEKAYIKAKSGYEIYIHFFDKSTHLQTSVVGWVSEYEISSPSAIRLAIRKSNNSNILPSENANVSIYAIYSEYLEDGALFRSQSVNRLTLANRLYSKQYSVSNNVVSYNDSTDYDVSDYIECYPFTVIRCCRFETNGDKTVYEGSSVLLFDNNKQFLAYKTYTQLADGAPVGTCYIRILIKKNLRHMLTFDNILPDSFVPYAKFETVQTAYNNHWNGKKWYAYGTSLTNTNIEGQYPRFVDLYSGLDRVNKANSGAGITSYSNGNNYNAIMNITDGKTEADLITLEVGANDMGAPLGSIYDDANNTTFCGALNKCIRYLQANTNAQIVIISSTNARKNNNGDYATPEYTYGSDNHTKFDQWEAIEKVCKLNSCYYIPMGETANMSYARMNASNMYNVDNIHHTALGGLNLGKYVWSVLKDIPLWETSI